MKTKWDNFIKEEEDYSIEKEANLYEQIFAGLYDLRKNLKCNKSEVSDLKSEIQHLKDENESIKTAKESNKKTQSTLKD